MLIHQLLHLMADELVSLKVANRHPRTPHQHHHAVAVLLLQMTLITCNRFFIVRYISMMSMIAWVSSLQRAEDGVKMATPPTTAMTCLTLKLIALWDLIPLAIKRQLIEAVLQMNNPISISQLIKLRSNQRASLKNSNKIAWLCSLMIQLLPIFQKRVCNKRNISLKKHLEVR